MKRKEKNKKRIKMYCVLVQILYDECDHCVYTKCTNKLSQLKNEVEHYSLYTVIICCIMTGLQSGGRNIHTEEVVFN